MKKNQIELIKKDLIIKPYTFDMTGFNDKSKEEDKSNTLPEIEKKISQLSGIKKEKL